MMMYLKFVHYIKNMILYLIDYTTLYKINIKEKKSYSLAGI
jgi:hypothetical protein